ncbi:hypothetical protein NUU61_002009 [Penicillium alfredii]|uniref:Hydrophobin n=1 Tax=Penicillium alfredii TaxID=1506179 RepID=A0A9W9FRD8_9EURO|nr:uncharacterized protein NUU61_002009 [Penicillium alfredii]KAJ5104662.1 hypothetical protein NUU61_002009 [Penicillium alfredii]
MRFTTLTYLATLLSLTTAIPVVHDSSSTTPSPTATTKPSGTASASASASASSSLAPYSCPKHTYKQCCQSLEQTSHEVIKPLGSLVPILSGVQVGSALSFQCKPMGENDAPDSCDAHDYTPMCCSNKGSGTINSCKSFAKSKEEYYKKMMHKQSQADMINEVAS